MSSPLLLVCSVCSFFLYDTPPTEIYTLSLHDALPIYSGRYRRRSPAPAIPACCPVSPCCVRWRRAARGLRSRDSRWQIGRAQSELQSRFDLVCRLLLEKKKKKKRTITNQRTATTTIIT